VYDWITESEIELSCIAVSSTFLDRYSRMVSYVKYVSFHFWCSIVEVKYYSEHKSITMGCKYYLQVFVLLFVLLLDLFWTLEKLQNAKWWMDTCGLSPSGWNIFASPQWHFIYTFFLYIYFSIPKQLFRNILLILFFKYFLSGSDYFLIVISL